MAIHLFKKSRASTPNINEWVRTYRQDPQAVLLDVRTDEEYGEGHIPGSVHLELGRESELPRIAPDPRTPLYVYCRSGSRSESAGSLLHRSTTNPASAASTGTQSAASAAPAWVKAKASAQQAVASSHSSQARSIRFRISF